MNFLNRHKRAFLLVGMAICLAAMFITVNPDFRPTMIRQAAGHVIVPLQQGATAALNWAGGHVSLFWENRSLQYEVTALREEIGWLQIENQRLRLAGDENERLTALLYLRQRYAELPIVGAAVIGVDPSDWRDSFYIDRGESDGIYRNMAVLGVGGGLAGGGLAGVVREAYVNSAQVVSILDDRFNVAVQSVRTEDMGIVRGEITLMHRGLMRMDRISADAQIMAGDEVITSHLSTVFPPGIPVGQVIEVRPTPDGLAQYAIVRPFANVARLENVLVVNQLFGDNGVAAVLAELEEELGEEPELAEAATEY